MLRQTTRLFSSAAVAGEFAWIAAKKGPACRAPRGSGPRLRAFSGLCTVDWRVVVGFASIAGCELTWSAPAFADEPTIEEVEHDPGEKPPPGTPIRLFFTGFALTAGWYGVALGTSYLWNDAPNAKDLRLPVVGPYLAFGNVGCGNSETNCTTFTVVIRTTFTALSAVGQTGGIVGMVESFFLPTAEQNRTALHGELHSARVTTAPLVTDDVTGWSLLGQF